MQYVFGKPSLARRTRGGIFFLTLVTLLTSEPASAVYYNLGAFWKGSASSPSAPPTDAISAGDTHTCALVSDGTARCWGLNTNGQLGDASSTTSTTPVIVSGLTSADAIAAGQSHSCAVLSDGTARCWGLNTNGQLGNGSSTQSTTPVTVSGLTGATTIDAGTAHSCALLSGGTVECWGLNTNGQLGDGSTAQSTTPVTVSGLTGATAITTGASHSCAVLSDGTVQCWGLNTNGQLGNGNTTQSTTPVTVSGLTGATAIAAGASQTCAVLSDGTAQCWGYNSNGQLGNGNTTQSLTPVTVSGLSGTLAIAIGDFHACAALTDGTVECWGANHNGQLGDGSVTQSLTPISVSGLSGAAAIAAGSGGTTAANNHSCAMLTDGSVRCWGDYASGQLGTGNATDTTPSGSTTPVTVPDLSNMISVSTSGGGGGSHSCGIKTDGTVRCWGFNGTGSLGNGSTTDSVTPVTVSGLTNASIVSTGYRHSCALISDGTARCWGVNANGQLGSGNTTQSTTPVSVSGLTGASILEMGGSHTCVLLSDGTARCWGINTNGQLGNGSTTQSTIPVTVSGLTDGVSLASGASHACAIKSDGTVRCWGKNSNGQLGDGSITQSTVPVTVSGLSGVVALAPGASHTCALLSDATARCWGINASGQLGNGSTTQNTTPVTVSGLTDVAVIAAGSSHTCAVITDGTIRCWGLNTSGQLGNGSTTNATTPVTVSGITGAIAVAPGSTHTCAVLADTSVRCWGDNAFGQIGWSLIQPVSTGVNQVYGFDYDTSSPLTSITGTSPVDADGISASTITIQLTQGSGSAWSGVIPTFYATDTAGRNIAGACSSSNGSGVSTCSLKSGYAELKDLWLLTPVRARMTSANGISFTIGSSSKLLLSGPTTLAQDKCSSRPYQLALTDTGGNLTAAPSDFVATLSGLSSASLYSDPLCTVPLANSLGFLTGTSAWTFYVAATAGETLSLQASGGGYTNGNLSVTVQPGTSIVGTSSIVADGVSTSTITITLMDGTNTPISGVTPTFAATGTGNTLGACSVSDASGVSTCTLKSTKAETKTLSILTPVSKTGGTVTFIAGTASILAFNQNPSSSATLGQAFSTQPIVQIQDANGNATGSGTNTITLAPFTNNLCTAAASGTLSSSGSGLSVAASSGSATFSDVSYLSSLVPIYIRASTAGLTPACYGPITLASYLASGSGNNGGGATSVSITTPAGIAAGHVLFAAVAARTVGTTITAPAGWNSVVSTASAANLEQAVFYKVATGSEPSSYSFTLSSSVKAAGVVVAYAGIDTTTPTELSGGQANASSTSIVAPSLSPTQTSTILLGFYGTANSGVSTEPTGFTSLAVDASTGGSGGSRSAIMAADKVLTSSGATGTSTATGAGAGENIGQAIILKLQ